MNDRKNFLFHLTTTTKANGRTYHYFRVPDHLKQFFREKLIRLSDDRDEATREAQAILDGVESGRVVGYYEQELKSARKMLANATSRSKKRGMEIDISVEWIIQQMRKQQYRCAVTRLPFQLDWRERNKARRNAFAPSIDRADSDIGYTMGNCRVVLSAVNYAMNEWGLETYLEIAAAAARNCIIKTKVITEEAEHTVDEISKPFQTGSV